MRRLGKLGVVLLAGVMAAGLLYLIYTEAGDSAEERLCRGRGCYLCHARASPEPLDCLRSWSHGEPLVPVISRRLAEEHAWLAGEAAPEIAAYIARQQLPALHARQAGSRAEALYLAKCAACHGRRGEGTPGQYPPLMGSEWITGEPSRLPEILREGLREPISVKGESWDSVMLPPGVREADHALLIPYLREQFGAH